MLKINSVKYYKVKEGQTLREIADAFSVSEWKLAKENVLTKNPRNGQFLRIPDQRGNAYIVQENDTKELLSGSEANYEEVNGTKIFYIGMRVII